MEMCKWIYEGPLYYRGDMVGEQVKFLTYAHSIDEAKYNILDDISYCEHTNPKHYNLLNECFRKQKDESDKIQILLHRKCPECDSLLTDGGYCPKCDLGEKD